MTTCTPNDSLHTQWQLPHQKQTCHSLAMVSICYRSPLDRVTADRLNVPNHFLHHEHMEESSKSSDQAKGGRFGHALSLINQAVNMLQSSSSEREDKPQSSLSSQVPTNSTRSEMPRLFPFFQNRASTSSQKGTTRSNSRRIWGVCELRSASCELRAASCELESLKNDL